MALAINPFIFAWIFSNVILSLRLFSENEFRRSILCPLYSGAGMNDRQLNLLNIRRRRDGFDKQNS
ncbi:MAG: hypothetical protein KDD28_04510, partial [Phaeodactylibacter sp.]|nr:hypothetical protein [Phaeodactylibacter sp.]